MKMVEVACAERLMSMSYQRGHALWMCKAAEPEDYHSHGCRREGQNICGREGHHSCCRLDGAEGARGSCACDEKLAEPKV